jgi:hypothetical protein
MEARNDAARLALARLIREHFEALVDQLMANVLLDVPVDAVHAAPAWIS